MYQLLKILHVLGVVIFMGNILVTAVWKMYADRSRELGVLRFGQRLVRLTDIWFTGAGALVVLVSGLWLSFLGSTPFWQVPWMLWGLIFFSCPDCSGSCS